MQKLAILTAIATFGAFSLTAPLFAEMKGGEQLNNLNALARQAESATPGAHRMSCLVQTKSSVDAGARGAFKSSSVYTAHQCGTCETKEAARGTGKMATRTMEHGCKSAGTCCNGKS